MAGAKILFVATGLCLTVCAGARADETCALRVQNNDTGQRAVDHLRVSPSSQARADDLVTVNRIVLPGHENVTAIHWNCTTPARSYTIVGLSTEGQEIVVGEAVPVTIDTDVENQPLAELATKSR